MTTDILSRKECEKLVHQLFETAYYARFLSGLSDRMDFFKEYFEPGWMDKPVTDYLTFHGLFTRIRHSAAIACTLSFFSQENLLSLLKSCRESWAGIYGEYLCYATDELIEKFAMWITTNDILVKHYKEDWNDQLTVFSELFAVFMKNGNS